MASFIKRGKTWQYTVSRMVNGKSKPIRKSGFRTKKEAQIAAAEVESALQKGVAPELNPRPINEYFSNWIDLYKTNISERTLKHYKYSLQAIENFFGSIPLQDIKRSDYQAFINDFGATRSKETMEKLNSHVRACIKDAVEDGIIPFDFTRKVNLTWTTPAKKANEKHLDYDDSQRLLNELRNRLDDGIGYYLLLLGLVSGLRFGELVGLTRKDFDFINNTINVEKTWLYMGSEIGFGSTKNDESMRVIKIDRKTMEAFRRLFNTTPTNINQLVFFSPQSRYKVISNSGANKSLKVLLEGLGIDPITMHGLRHTHASVLLYQKVSMNYVSERLGHKDVETTWKTYSHILNEMRTEDEEKTTSIFENMIV